MAKIQAEAEEKKRYRQKRNDEDEIKMVKVEADEDLTIKQMELNAQARTFTCGNVERPRSSGNFKKSNSNGLTSNDEAIYNAACRVQSNDGQIYIGVAS